MKKFSASLAILLCGALLVPPGSSQEREDRTLLNWDQMRAIINEASGDRAVHTVLELVPYARVRNRAEYEGNFRESVVMASQAKEAGYSNIEIESFPSNARIWHASQAELWMTAPQLRKLYDVYDIGVSACSGSETGDVTADVVDVGIGARVEDYANKEVAGKIVLGSASSNVLQRLAVFDRGAVGVLSYDALRQDQYIDQLLTQSISTNAPQGKKPGFGWSISVRTARDISARLGRGVKVTMRSVIKAETFPGELETVHAVIPGDGSTTQEVIVSAHLYEGYQKQGANDDNSGCAMTLEAGRAYLRLVKDGFLPKPKRTIHFLWVPEISGTIAWLNKHQDIKNRLIADLNFDMEGLGLRMSGATWILHRTPDSFPSFLNDLCASVLEFVANLNRERVRYRLNGYGFTWPVVSQNGSWDPFYVTLEKYYSASDHAVYLQQGIPAVIFNTWPDPFYHSSFDTPDKMDPTQFKRAAVVTTAAMTILATAGDELAARVSAESLARGTERMGQAQRKGL
ncbi:MAG: M28 family peptidase, partial [Acidobacteria bacterium]|nr:M28 family peptidase [Acidobacteriota bacterium]